MPVAMDSEASAPPTPDVECACCCPPPCFGPNSDPAACPFEPMDSDHFCKLCIVPCDDEHCDSPIKSDQCDENCVIVPCTEPPHAKFPYTLACFDDCEMQPCPDGLDADCRGATACLQCCTIDHTYSSDSNADSSLAGWDSLGDYLLDQAPPGQQRIADDQSVDAFMQMLAPASIQSPAPAFGFGPPTPSSQMRPFQGYGGIVPDPRPPPNMIGCQWADCGAYFMNMADLIKHVNTCHLYTQYTGGSNRTPGSGVSCLWGDCQVSPAALSVPPGPSNMSYENAMLGVLNSHLLQDHLGLSNPQASKIPYSPRMRASSSGYMHFPPSASDSATDRSTPPSGSASPLPQIPSRVPPSHLHHEQHDRDEDNLTASSNADHDCSASHTCHWKDCGRTFSSCAALTAHLSLEHVGSGKNRYHCFWQDCSRNGESGFTSKQKILRHLQSHTGHRPFQCTVCQQSFSEAATLQQHMRRHTQEKPYVCDFPGCNKAFTITGALTIHKRTHNGDKPFKCRHCEKTFAESSNLAKHERTHTGVRPYSCTEPGCDKSFARPDQLTRHMLTHSKKANAAGQAGGSGMKIE